MKTTFAVALVFFGIVSAQAQTQASAGAKANQPVQSALPAQLKIDPTKEADIRRLMDVAGTKDLVSGQMDRMGETIKPLMSKALPPGEYREQLVALFFTKFKSEADLQKLLDLIVPIYDRYLSDEEVKGLINFYQTPLGQKAVHVMPKLMADAAEEGRKWGEALGRQSMMDVLAEHPELAEALKKASKETAPQSIDRP